MKQECPTCGAKLVQYKHRLSATNVRGLVALHRVGEASPYKDLGLTYSQIENLRKLQYWGFIEQPKARSGQWKITDLGRRFVCGLESAPASVWTYRGIVTAVDHRLVMVWGALPKDEWRAADYAAFATPLP